MSGASKVSDDITMMVTEAVNDKDLEFEVAIKKVSLESKHHEMLFGFLLAAEFTKGGSEASLDINYSNKHGDTLRFTIRGMDNIENLCLNGDLDSLPTDHVTLMAKTQYKRPIDDEDYNIRYNLKNERMIPGDSEEYKNNIRFIANSSIPKVFRSKHRTSFTKKGYPFQIDITTVSMYTATGAEPTFVPVDIVQVPPVLEVEIELVDKKSHTVTELVSRLGVTIGNLYRVIQKTDRLYTSRDETKIFGEYFSATEQGTGGAQERTRPGYINPKPRSLSHRNILASGTTDADNIFSVDPVTSAGMYAVTYKADGYNATAMKRKNGDVVIIPDTMSTVIYTNYRVESSEEDGDTGVSLFQCEVVTVPSSKAMSARELIYLFDTVVADDTSVWAENLTNRVKYIRNFIKRLTLSKAPTGNGVTNPIHKFLEKQHYFPTEKTPMGDIIKAMGRVIDVKTNNSVGYVNKNKSDTDYGFDSPIDGLVFTKTHGTINQFSNSAMTHIYKWKDAKFNTVDLLVKIVDKTTARLYAGVNNRQKLNVVQQVYTLSTSPPAKDYVPIQVGRMKVTPAQQDRPGAFVYDGKSTMYVAHELDRNSLVVYDDTIVEFMIEAVDDTIEFIPLRPRDDKTQKYRASPNKTITANDYFVTYLPIVELVTNPIPLSMFATGHRPTEVVNSDIYYSDVGSQRAVAPPLAAMNAKHNQYKIHILRDLAAAGAGADGVKPSLFDIGVGRAGDLTKWSPYGRVIGLDRSFSNVYTIANSAYGRLHAAKTVSNKFVIPDDILLLTYDITTPFDGDHTSVGDAIGDSDTITQNKKFNKNMLDLALGKTHSLPSNYPTSLVDDWVMGMVSNNLDCATSMFALHYFLDSEAMFGGFCRNLQRALRKGGVFSVTILDYDLLRPHMTSDKRFVARVDDDDDASAILVDVVELDNTASKGSLYGNKINVYIDSIGIYIRENTINVALLNAQMKKNGFEVYESDETSLSRTFADMDIIYGSGKSASKNMTPKLASYSYSHRVMSWTLATTVSSHHASKSAK